MPTVMIGKKTVHLVSQNAIGKGGEADVYGINGVAIKIFKLPDDPDYANDPIAQQGAVERIQEQQEKLPAFPHGLPSEVVTPLDLAYRNVPEHPVCGYTMRMLDDAEVLLRYGDRRYREQGAIDGNQVLDVFRRLHSVVESVHRAGVVIGDFNDLNVLVDEKGESVSLVDADSMQFGRFHCRTFTLRFVDPLHSGAQLGLAWPHTEGSDWYAFNTMLFQSLLYVGPYGGVHRPQSGPRLQHDARVMRRITIFDPDVVYPRPALPLSVLPDELLEHFHRVYEEDEREPFPMALLDATRWTRCSRCGTEHARQSCSSCSAPVKHQPVVNLGEVTATKIFSAPGPIVYAKTTPRGELFFLYHDGTSLFREGGRRLFEIALSPALRFRIQRSQTLMGRGNWMWVHGHESKTFVDAYGGLSMIDANSKHRFWVQDGGQLVKDNEFGSEYIGDVIDGRTLFWVGEKFGFGFYRAGELMRSFVFETTERGFNDQVDIPAIPGQLVDSSCTISDTHAWFMATVQVAGRLENRCYVIDRRGNVVVAEVADATQDHWLSQGIRGSFAAGSSLFAPTDAGIVRIEMDGAGRTRVAQEFADTEPFVDSSSYLLPATGGIYVVSGNEITLLKIGGK